MLTNRVTKRKIGYDKKKPWVHVPYKTKGAIEFIELRCQEGYLLGWTVDEKGIKVYMRYTIEGKPCMSKRKRRWKPSRTLTVDAEQIWSAGQINGERGTLIRQTTNGRITSIEARKKKLGGMRWVWVI